MTYLDHLDKKWNMQYEKIVEFKRKNGHCLVPKRYEQDKSLGAWVSDQRSNHINNKLRLDRKRLLDQIGFTWKDISGFKPDDKRWNVQYEQLVEFKRKNGHCLVPKRYEEDKSLGG
jgi:hypothetical protein